jgi:hypothetical protein
MAFSLGALGAGLGQFAEQYQRQQESALRQMQTKMALDQLQRTLRERALAGQALSAGGIPGFGGGGGGLPGMPTTPISGQTLPAPGGGSPQMPSFPQAGMGAPSAPPPLSGNTGKPTGVMPLDDDPESQAYAQERGAAMGVPVLSPDAEREPSPSATPPQDDGLPRIGADGLQKGYSPEEYQRQFGGGGAPSAAPGASAIPDAASSGASTSSTDSAGITLDDMPAYLQMFRHVDPVAIAQRIKQIRPDADDSSVLGATETLVKLAQGGLREQQTAAGMMKYLMGDATRRQLAAQTDSTRRRGQDMTSADRGAQRDVTVRGQDTRAATAAAGQAGVQKRFEARISEQRYQRALARADGQSKLALSEMHRQMNDIRQRIAVIDNGPNATSGANKQTRDALAKQFDDLAERERKRAESVLGAADKE